MLEQEEGNPALI